MRRPKSLKSWQKRQVFPLLSNANLGYYGTDMKLPAQVDGFSKNG